MSKGFSAVGFTIVAGLDHEPATVSRFAVSIPARGVLADIGEVEDPLSVITLIIGSCATRLIGRMHQDGLSCGKT
jgi:hypothetical protein